jgi:serine/threonine protein phosphatase 1
VVHGHTILDEPVAEGGRIGVDTGAYATGRLTAALIRPGGVSFVSA